MDIVRTSPDTERGSAQWFTGTVLIDRIARLAPPARLRLASVHFTPGARTRWHSHPLGQVLHVTEGAGLVQRRGGPVEAIRAGDTVVFAPGEWHWHGAGPRSFMTHLAAQEADDTGSDAEWGEEVSAADYPA